MARSSKIPRKLRADLVALVIHKIIAAGCLSRNLPLPRHLDDDRVGQPDKQTWPNKKRPAGEKTMLIESQLADFHAQKGVARDCRRCGKRDCNRVFLLPCSADASEGGRIAEIEGRAVSFWMPAYLPGLPTRPVAVISSSLSPFSPISAPSAKPKMCSVSIAPGALRSVLSLRKAWKRQRHQ
jgi:hypothetical protein